MEELRLHVRVLSWITGVFMGVWRSGVRLLSHGNRLRLPFIPFRTMKYTTNKAPLIFVRWVDSSSPAEGRWHDPESLSSDVMYCESAGYLIEQTNDVYIIAGHISLHDSEISEISGVMIVPKVAVVELKTLKGTKCTTI